MTSMKRRADSAMSVSSSEIECQLELDLERGQDQSADPQDQRAGQQPGQDEREQEDETSESVAVMVRCRPMNESERLQRSPLAIQVDESQRCLEVDKERQFYFDQVFGPEATNEQVYMKSARRLVEFAFQGFNCTIFLYGQTGTGKTYTHSSLTLSAFEHLFSLIQDSNKRARFLIRASYYELYNEEIRDLLAPLSGAKDKTLELRESKERGVYVKDLACFLVSNLNELMKLKRLGDKRRTTGATKMNEHSSRAHSIFSITIETISSADAEGTNDDKQTRGSRVSSSYSAMSKGKPKQESSLRLGRLHLIDLAGSERQAKSGSSGLRLKEASRINLSLTCLSLVIRALTDKTSGGHIPYRNSKLTRLLSSSLGGNSKTLLIACVSPSKLNLDESLNTLRFASRTKQIKNRAVINEDPKDALLRKYKRQLNELRQKLSEQQQQAFGGGWRGSEGTGLEGDELDSKEQVPEKDAMDQQQLMKQLELLKAKIMFGGENLLDKVELHERLLEASRQELEERRQEEAKLRERLQGKSQAIKMVVQSRGSLEGQRAYLDEKLRKALGLYKRSKLELRDLTSEHEQLKEQLLQTIRSTSKEIKYVDCILDDFIPRE